MNDIVIKINPGTIKDIENKVRKAAFEAIQDAKIQVDKEQTVPFLSGSLDDSAHISETRRNGDLCIELHYSTPYAVRRYYEPANFTTTFHENATDHWLKGKENFVIDKFIEHYKEGGEK